MKIFNFARLAPFFVLLLASPAWAAEAGQDQGWNFVLRVINFAVFLFILLFFARKPIANALRGRQEKVKQELDELEASREVAARTRAEAAELLTQAEAESKRLLQEYRIQAEAERVRILEQAETQIKHMHEQARLTIAREMIIAQEHLKKELAGAAVLAAEELLQKQITTQDRMRLNQDFLANLAEGKAGGK